MRGSFLLVLAPLMLAACGDRPAAPETDGDAGNDALSIGLVPENAAAPAGPPRPAQRGPSWFYRDDPGGGLALFGQPGGQGLFAIRCDRRGGQILFQRAAAASDATEIGLTIDGGETRYPAHRRAGGTPRIEAAAAIEDPVLNQLASARSIGVAARGTETLSLPGNGVVRRVVEACRTPAKLAAVPDGARFAGTIPCPDCPGVDVLLSFSAKGPETERFRLVRVRQGEPGSQVQEGSVVMLGNEDPPLYRLTPDGGGTPVYVARVAADRFVFRTADNKPDPELAKHPLARTR